MYSAVEDITGAAAYSFRRRYQLRRADSVKKILPITITVAEFPGVIVSRETEADSYSRHCNHATQRPH